MTRLVLPVTTGGAGSGGTTTGSVSVEGSATGSASWVSGSGTATVSGSGIRRKSTRISTSPSTSSLLFGLSAPLMLGRLFGSRLVVAFPGSAVQKW